MAAHRPLFDYASLAAKSTRFTAKNKTLQVTIYIKITRINQK